MLRATFSQDPSESIPKSTQFLQSRELSVNFDSLVGKTTIINKEVWFAADSDWEGETRWILLWKMWIPLQRL